MKKNLIKRLDKDKDKDKTQTTTWQQQQKKLDSFLLIKRTDKKTVEINKIDYITKLLAEKAAILLLPFAASEVCRASEGINHTLFPSQILRFS